MSFPVENCTCFLQLSFLNRKIDKTVQLTQPNIKLLVRRPKVAVITYSSEFTPIISPDFL